MWERQTGREFCEEALVWGQREIGHELGAIRLVDFYHGTVFTHFGVQFETYEPIIS